jgi:hypothetical protein
MQRAKAYGIDAFALDIGLDTYTDQQLQFAYESAANNGMKVFISFDFSYWSTSNATGVGQKIAQYASLPAQLQVGGRVFASSFIGDGLDVNALRSAAGSDVYFVPNFHPNTDTSTIDGALNWQVSFTNLINHSKVKILLTLYRLGTAMATIELLPTA